MLSPPDNVSLSDNVSVISDIIQLDGNLSICSDNSESYNKLGCAKPANSYRTNNALIATHLPIVSVCNMRSIFPKMKNFKTDLFERQVDVSLLSEVWEKAENQKHKAEIELMLEMEGLKYFSTTRPRGKRGGGAAIIVNTERFKVENLNVQIPPHLEVVWALAKPRSEAAKIKKIILCAFYSPPRSRLRFKLKDHIIGTLQVLTTRYPECGIFIGGDKNKMDISQFLNCNLKLKQIVNRPTRKQEILDVAMTNLFPYYNAPIIVPPVQPDVPGQGVPSDHSVPLCIPHTDPHNPPTRVYKKIISRPLPDSRIRDFGQWITSESWESLMDHNEPTQQVIAFEELVNSKLDEYFPLKETKIGVGDKPYMTQELKTLKRKRMKEYQKHGKSQKYKGLRDEFEAKLLKAKEGFMQKNIDTLKQSNPGQAYTMLKKMGAQPGECDEGNTFTLPHHENLSHLEAADKIAEHFARISREFPPIKMETLPERVVKKMHNPESESNAPVILEHQVYEKIRHANKPKSGVPGDLPRRLVNEFGPELSTPMCTVFNRIIMSAKQGSGKWPASWKLEYGTPLQKKNEPTTEDDLRIISLTAFFSKVMEHFVVEWLMGYIGDKLDPKQFGGLKGNSISHYMIELINFILYSQDYNLPVAVLACAIDFSKAFNRQNHNILLTKLSDMGVPGWLLQIVMGFLSDRVMVVRYKGEITDPKPLPGGGPQGTLLGLLLFLVLINQCGFDNPETNIGATITNAKKKFMPSLFHAKYVDDLTIAESIDLKESLVLNPDRPLPDPYHARTGQKLNDCKSQVYDQLNKIQAYAELNEMKLNFSKTKFMLFNPTNVYDFIPEVEVKGHDLETLEEMKMLGLILRNDLSWRSNTDAMVIKAYKRLWLIRRLKKEGACLDDLIDVYVKHVRSILEFGVPVWNSGLTLEEVKDIERVQKSFLHIVLGLNYINYDKALMKSSLETLEVRRTNLCIKFAKKSAKHPKHKHWFSLNTLSGPKTRSDKPDYKPPLCRLSRLQKSPIPYLTRLLNTQ